MQDPAMAPRPNGLLDPAASGMAMSDPNAKRPRTFQCRDVLWEGLEQMASELECSIDYLINEALKQYVRQRGIRTTSALQIRGEPSAPAFGTPPPPSYGAPPGMGGPQMGGPQMGGPQMGGPPPLQRSMTPMPETVVRSGAGAPAPPPMVARPPQMGAPPSLNRPGSAPGAPPPGPPPGYGAPPPHAMGGTRPIGPGDRPPPPPPPSGYAAPAQRYPGQAPTPPPPMGVVPTVPLGGIMGGPPSPAMGGQPHHTPLGGPPTPMGTPSHLMGGGPGHGPMGGPSPSPMSGPPPTPPPQAPTFGPGAMPTLFVSYGGQRHQVQKDRFIIGRGRQAVDLTIKDPNISRQHAMVEYHGGQFFIVDMGSTNGIEHNGQRITRKAIAEGDMVKICDHEVRFSFRPS